MRGAPRTPRVDQMTDLLVATASPDIRFGDLSGNISRIVQAISSATAGGAGLVVLPELATSGYVFHDAAEAASLAMDRDDPRWLWIHEALPVGVVLVVGYAELAGRTLFNTAAVLTATERLADYRKAHLWGAEKLVFTPGDTAGTVVDVPFGRLGVAICYDNEFPEVPRSLALAGADLLALPVNWPMVRRPDGEHPPELIQAMAAARSSRMPIVVADRAGEERGVAWTGGTAIVDELGWIAARTDTGIATAVLSLAAVRDKSLPPHNDLFSDRRPELY